MGRAGPESGDDLCRFTLAQISLDEELMHLYDIRSNRIADDR